MPQTQASAPSNLTAVVLAAGAGTRMKSRTSKVLHRMAGRALLQYPVLAALRAGADKVVVVTNPAHRDDIAASLEELRVEAGPAASAPFELAIQHSPRGSGDAARAALPALKGGLVLVLNGDAPSIEAAQFDLLVDRLCAAACDVALVT